MSTKFWNFFATFITQIEPTIEGSKKKGHSRIILEYGQFDVANKKVFTKKNFYEKLLTSKVMCIPNSKRF